MAIVFDLTWFLATPFGKPFDPLEQNVFDLALAVSEAELSEVKCNCPDLYAYALQIKISLVLAQMAPTADGQVAPPVQSTGKVAYVTADKVFDTQRNYTLVDEADQVKASSPANILQGIMARCTLPLRIGAVLARSFSSGSGCGCGPNPETMGLNPDGFGLYGDKADN